MERANHVLPVPLHPLMRVMDCSVSQGFKNFFFAGNSGVFQENAKKHFFVKFQKKLNSRVEGLVKNSQKIDKRMQNRQFLLHLSEDAGYDWSKRKPFGTQVLDNP